MAAGAGNHAKIMCSGAATSFVGEATTATGNVKYQITDTAKRVLDRTASISVHLYDADDTAEGGTTTTNITMTGHGLVTGDLIVNTTRSNAARLVTKVDDDNVTVTAVTSQTSGDTIAKYNTEATTAYTLNRLSGYATYASATSRTIRISGSYLPMTEMAQAYNLTYSISGDNQDVTTFGDDWIVRIQGQKDFTCSAGAYWLDETYQSKLVGMSLGNTAEAGTTTTNITITDHGLAVGDQIVNADRSYARRTVTVVVDADNVTIDSAVTSQTSGDTIDFYYKDVDPVVLELYDDRTGAFDMKAWVLLASDDVEASVDGVVEESMEFEGTGDADNRTISID